ncbi:hypothetical protein AAFF_G00114390 [Aldrovandia affinis]|uniref:Uncharacterized protein n=1 Tax=Aldrovandia affinis TaxID=143900 RepID=A0AAD7RT92_9TELE|nr:hypothetical protein AAFF_G00114390 [Aldrovandia affinis]
MAGDCAYETHYVNDDTFGNKQLLGRQQELVVDSGIPPSTATGSGKRIEVAAASSPNFELIDGVLHRKKLERGYINYREVLDRGGRHDAIAACHREPPGRRHRTLDDTYRTVSERYWWEGMYFHIREYVHGCRQCQEQKKKKKREEAPVEPHVSRTLVSHGNDVLCKLRGQREAGLFCDITLQTGGRSFYAHRAVLAAVSEYFQEIFAEMDSSSGPQPTVDLTDFSEESFLPLLEFSYTSTLSMKVADLTEVSTMAQHFRMWPAVEACRAIQMELGAAALDWGPSTQKPSPRVHPPAGNVFHERACPTAGAVAEGLHRKRKRGRSSGEEDDPERGLLRKRPALGGERIPDEGFTLTLDPSDESGGDTPGSPAGCGRGGRRTRWGGGSETPGSPVWGRLKLMDFKSPYSKRKTSPRNPPPAPFGPQEEQRAQGETSLKPTHSSLSSPSSSSSRRYKQRLSFAEVGGESGPVGRVERAGHLDRLEEEVTAQSPRTLEKYRLLSVLGLQRKGARGPEELTGWQQKKRLRRLKVSSYSLTARRKPRPPAGALSSHAAGVPEPRPLIGSPGTALLRAVIKTEPPEPISMEEMRLLSLPSGCTELRRSVRCRDPSEPPSRKSVRVKREPAAFPIQPPAPAPAPAPAKPSAHSHHRGESGYPLFKAKPGRPRKVPLDRAGGKQGPPYSGLNAQGLRYSERNIQALRFGQGPGARRESRTESRQNSARGTKPQESQRAGGRAARGKRPGRRANPRQDNSNRGGIGDLLRIIKDEPVEPVAVSGPAPTPAELGKRQSRRPIKLLDPGFLFDFCRPSGVKKEEESVDICLTRFVTCGGGNAERHARNGPQIPGRPRRSLRQARASLGVNRKQLRAKGGAAAPLPKGRGVRRVAGMHRGAQGGLRRPALLIAGKTKRTGDLPKKRALQPEASALLESARRARLKRLRGRRSHAPVTSHACVQCRTAYRNCDALVMHRIRHIEGKHWPCPLCSKTFFRQRNVQSHIRTHDPKLYKCPRCLSAS